MSFSVWCEEEGWFHEDGSPVVYDSEPQARGIMHGLVALFPARHYEVRLAPCLAETTLRSDEHQTARCALPFGHPGAHDDPALQAQWTDADTRFEDPAP